MGTATLVEGLLLIGLAAAGIWEGARLTRETLVAPEPLGPGWYLLSISAALMVCGLAYVVSSRRREATAKGSRHYLHFGPVAQASALLVLYPAVVPHTSYLIGTSIFFVLALHVFGMRSWIRSALMGIALALIFQFVFADLGGVPLPQPQWVSDLRIVR